MKKYLRKNGYICFIYGPLENFEIKADKILQKRS